MVRRHLAQDEDYVQMSSFRIFRSTDTTPEQIKDFILDEPHHSTD